MKEIAKAIIANFRRGRHTYTPRQYILVIEGVASKKDAEKFIGKTVIWQTKGKKQKTIKGRITALHGNNGHVRALFEKGLPGQAIATRVSIVE